MREPEDRRDRPRALEVANLGPRGRSMGPRYRYGTLYDRYSAKVALRARLGTFCPRRKQSPDELIKVT